VATPESGRISTWLYKRARAIILHAQRRDDGTERPPRRKGLVITVCILASVLLWFTFAMRETYTRVLEFPTEVRNLPADEALIDLPPRLVRAQVEGEGIQLIRLYYDPPVIPIDAASESVDLTVLAPDVVKNVRLDAVMPRTVVVYKEPRIQRRVPVRSAVSVTTPAGHHLIGSLVVDPDSVWVSGAQSIVGRLGSWPTSARPVDAAKDTLFASVPLSDSLSGLVTLSEVSATVRGQVREFTEGTRMVDVFVLDAPPGQQVSLEPARVRLTFQVPVGQYDAAMAADLWAAVPYVVIRDDTTGSVVPTPRFPEGIVFRQVRIDPQALRYYDVLE
jgi:hypothetical protein